VAILEVHWPFHGHSFSLIQPYEFVAILEAHWLSRGHSFSLTQPDVEPLRKFPFMWGTPWRPKNRDLTLQGLRFYNIPGSPEISEKSGNNWAPSQMSLVCGDFGSALALPRALLFVDPAG
jgi:hypothetical protein